MNVSTPSSFVELRDSAAPADPGTSANAASPLLLFGVTICVGAFLLFQVQLIIGKYILPWFGGTPAVWTSCMLVFQVLLLAGYFYAHVLTSYVPAKLQGAIHLSLLACSVILLMILAVHWKTPITPGMAWKPNPHDNPVWKIVQFLSVSVAFPFFLLSTTGPLVQKWFAGAQTLRSSGQARVSVPRARPNSGKSPYRLYALSNLGSLLGLLSYPFLIEPTLRVSAQAWTWCFFYAVYVMAAMLCLRQGVARGAEHASAVEEIVEAQPKLYVRLLWVGLAACASVMLLATTNVICQQVAVIPFLWVLPLCLYLGSFIVCFDSPRWYSRAVFQPLFLVLAGVSCWLLLRGPGAPVYLQLLVYPALLFVCCMVCHGEVVRIKPGPQHLTQFYLLIAFGGVVGGMFTGLLAPHIFSNLWEFHSGIIASAVLLLLTQAHDGTSWWHKAPSWLPSALLCACALLAIPALKILAPQADAQLFYALGAVAGLATVMAAMSVFSRQRSGLASPVMTRTAALIAVALVSFALFADARLKPEDVRLRSRNFYGVISIVRATSVAGPYFYLRNGLTNHGVQFVRPEYANAPTTYYGPESGISRLLLTHPRPMRVGLVGLGIGTLVAFGQPGDTFRFYEINPAVISVASGPSAFFTYMRNTQATTEVVLGDARLSLEREADAGQLQSFDVLVVDAFSGDAIPTHLLTKEAMALYLRHLRSPESVIAMHISNISLDLGPVVSGLAHEFQLQAVRIHHPEGKSLSSQSDWVLLSRTGVRLEPRLVSAAAAPLPYDPSVPLWTDDYSNLFRVIHFSSGENKAALPR